MTYSFAQESFTQTYPEIEPLYREHYAEMKARKESIGIPTVDYNPRLDQYIAAEQRGDLLTFIVRNDGTPVGYCNVYLTSDMHNHDKIACEDTVFVTKGHRNGIGRKLVLFGLDQLRQRGAKSLDVSALTDPRIVNLWKRMGFKEVAVQMTYVF